ncbi:agmatine deiminase family protein [Spirulina sp. 06S082]|uniref:agmatine deiminase family protein n=1 Tax=Spirulina sp. 06S082 TaxID=3110248 RepID=UPI002B1F6971|nr:agmatine deiminase family protein [Spirulina sp. 06S082]MEA5472051.1 agmatine deiminase family protein [Spirulina sp. 06S082]
MKRQFFLQLMATTSVSLVLGKSLVSCSAVNSQTSNKMDSSLSSDSSFFMPDEADRHLCTWMAFSANADIWGREYFTDVQDNLAKIARAIANYEPVKMLVRQEDYDIARAKCGSKVELIIASFDDLWMRDTGPVFVVNEEGEKAAIDFNFNGWGNKQDHDRDAEVAQFVAQKSGVPLINTKLVFEGGGVEVDGRGTAIVTESCIINDNRNPGWTKADCEEELKALLGLRKIIWLPGIKGADITDGHTDFYARFTSPGVVVVGYDPDRQSFDHEVTKKHIEILRSQTDAEGNKLEVVILEGPTKIRSGYDWDDFAAGYINFYVINGAVIAPEFGDRKADRKAKETLARLFPNRDIIQLNIDDIAAGGGGIHCTTQQEPLV